MGTSSTNCLPEGRPFSGEHLRHCPEQDFGRIKIANVAVGTHQLGEQGRVFRIKRTFDVPS